MKKILIALFAVSALISCSNNNLDDSKIKDPIKEQEKEQDKDFNEIEESYINGGPHYSLKPDLLTREQECVSLEIVSADGNEDWIVLEKDALSGLPTRFSLLPNFTGASRHALLSVEYRAIKDGPVQKQTHDVFQRSMRKSEINYRSGHDTVISAEAHKIEFGGRVGSDGWRVEITKYQYDAPREIAADFAEGESPRPVTPPLGDDIDDSCGPDFTNYLVEGDEFYFVERNPNIVIVPEVNNTGAYFKVPVVGAWSYYTRSKADGYINALYISENTSGKDRVVCILESEYLVYRVTQKARK